MSSLNSFMGRFGGQGEDSAPPDSQLVPASAPNALGAFMETFSTLTDESYWFYNHTIELRYDVAKHEYYRVDPELGNLIRVKGVTKELKIIDKSNALVPWASKKCAEKILRTIPLSSVLNEFNEIMLAPISLTDFTKLVMEAKNAHKEILEDSGDVGHAAHRCLEVSIQYAIDHTNGVVLELRELPADEKAKACAEAGFAWMQAHKVRWIKTEQKIYSREYQYAGTLDGKALVDSCDDPACCSEQFKDSLSIVDWKSSNALHVEYVLQAAGAYCRAEMEEHSEDIQNCFILRLGKNEEEAGKFEPWRVPARDFPEAFQGFLLCLQLVDLLEAVKERMSEQKKGVREIKKQQRIEQKEIAKMKAKVEKAAAKAQLKLDRAAEKERIKADAKAAREQAKNVGRPKPDNEVPGQAEDASHIPDTLVEENTMVLSQADAKVFVEALTNPPEPNEALKAAALAYEEAVERKPYVIPEEEP